MVNPLLLFTGQDIPFPQAQLIIHQPTINEIAIIGGEEIYRTGVQIITSIKNLMEDKDKNVLENESDFQIFIAVVNTPEAKYYKNCVTLVLLLLFPEYDIKINIDNIALTKDDTCHYINNSNFDTFKEYLIDVFDIKNESSSEEYNPANAMAEKIAEKFKKRKEKLRQQDDVDLSKISVFKTYISILAVGENKSIQDLCKYTVVQLNDEFKRFQRKEAWDVHIKAQLAGATNLDEMKHWTDDNEN